MRTKKCFRKMYVCLLAALLFPQWAAAENVQKLIIVKNDNTEVSILLSDEPKMHFSHYYHVNYSQEMCNLIITTSDGNTKELDSYNLDKMTVVSTDDVVTKVNNLMDNAIWDSLSIIRGEEPEKINHKSYVLLHIMIDAVYLCMLCFSIFILI